MRKYSLLLLAAAAMYAGGPSARAEPGRDAAPAAPLLADAPAVTEESAKEIAKKFLAEKKTDWGEPLRVEKYEKDFRVIFPTSEKEVKMLHWRTVVVTADGKAKFMPRR